MCVRNLFATMKKVLFEKPFTIAVEGNIGSGKTTFLNHVAKLGNVSILAEPLAMWRNCQGHNLLDIMYENPKKFAFTFQSYVQLTLLQAHLQQTPHRFKLMERSLFSARYCFLEKLYRDGNLTAPEFSVVDEWFKWIREKQDIRLDLIIYLKTDPEVVYERILARARREEKQVPFEYVKSLHELHENWLVDKSLGECPAPVFIINGNADLEKIDEEYKKVKDYILTERHVTLEASSS